jgi:opacity protein-like surface antigen
MRFPIKSAVAALVAAMSCTAVFAADLLRAPYSPAQNDDVPVEFGTGWYIRGDIAAAQDNANAFGRASLLGMKPPNGWSAGLGAGYKFTNFLRADLTVDYRSPVTTNGIAGTLTCVTGAEPVRAPDPVTGLPTGAVIGSTPVFDNCTGIAHSRLNRTHVLANAYVDLGTWSRFTPYIGAGIGVNVTYNKSQLNWFMSNQDPYNITFTDPFTQVVVHEFMDTQRTGFRYNLAWALMGGVAFDLTPHLKLDIGYRYLSLGNYSAIDSSGNPITKQMRAQEIRTGFRYVID